MPLSDNERLGCYAMLRSFWNTKSDYLAPFERMLVSVLNKHKGNHITIEEAIKEIMVIWKVDVPRMPMNHLFSRLATKNILTKKHNDRRYLINKDSIKSNDAVSESEVSSLANRFERIVIDCQRFCLSQSPSLPATPDQIKTELISFLSQQSISLAINANHQSYIVSNSGHSFYRIGLFIDYLRENDSGTLHFLNDIAIGHILCKCLLLDGSPVESLSELTIYLDADIIFILLGIDSLGRTDDYKRLFKDVRDLGASLKVFQHNIDEVNIGLDSAITWINSPDYDPSLASKAARFFVDNNGSVSDIEFIKSTLILTLRTEFGITVETASYDADKNPFNHDEKKIEETIIDKYIVSANGAPIEVDLRSIQKDAISINQVYRNRGGIKRSNISECKCVLVTTNVTLARAVKDYEKQEGYSENCISACITDALMGTLVWLSKPTRIEEESYARLNALARASFLPSEAEISEFSKQVGEAHKRGVITDEECYFLRTSHVSNEMLKRISAGTPSKINETTPEEVLKMILEKGKALAKAEATAEYNEKLNEQKSLSSEAIRVQKSARLNELKELQHEKEERMKHFVALKEKTTSTLKIWRCVFAISIIVPSVFSLVMFCRHDLFWGIIGGIPVIIAIILFAISIVAKKELNLFVVTELALSKLQKKYVNNLKLCDNEIDRLKNDINDIKSRIAYIESEIS